MLKNYKIKNGKKLRYGFTTGTCAAGAAKAACEMLYKQVPVKHVSLDTPKGWRIDLAVKDVSISSEFAYCCVIKDAGDDPDVTNGMHICARAVKTKGGIEITGGIGVGVVTRKGIAVDPGKPAINPVPMQMIETEVKRVMPDDAGVSIEISAPEGVSIAERTFNPRLGIEGGISIIGTTGIVEPMSEDSIKDSISLELSVLKESGADTAVFVPGNYGEKYALNELHINHQNIVFVSNFIGDMFNQAVFYKFKNILLIGHIGKLVKVAGGIFNTHSKFADARVEILASHYALFAKNCDSLKAIMESATTEEAMEYINDDSFYNYLALTIVKRCSEFVHNDITIEAVLFSEKKGLLGKSEGADELINLLRSNS